MIEQDTRFIIDSNLINKGWILDINNPKKNVFFENDILRIIDNPKLKKQKKRPDYVFIDNNKKPIGIIEAKAGGKNLDKALDQAMDYAEILKAPLIFAMNNSYCQTKHLYKNEPLYINENEVNELIRQQEALKFINEQSNEIYTIPKKIIISRQELISIFRNLNNTLRGEGLRAGIERLSEFANILFLKLYTENKADNVWDSIMKVDNEILINTVNQTLKHIEQKYGASVFTELQIKNPDTLREIINSLNNLTLSTIETDIKGDAFEYFLQQATATSNDLGEYFTPRHIIKTIINLVNPKFKETIYDPFCGTGGFLTEAFNHIKENTIISTKEDKEILKEQTIFGNEITTNSRLAKMNMILHGDGHSGIKQLDSLENPIENKYDIVVTNMPFSQKITKKMMKNGKEITKNVISPLYYNNLAGNSGDGVCLLHCFKSAQKNGRLAIIVPEGVLFRKTLKNVRRHLINHAVLKTVVSLPQGVFLPYAGVKTNILFFTNCHKEATKDKIWFFNVINDGFTLDNNRRRIKKNDLKQIYYVNFQKKQNKTDMLNIDIGFKKISLDEIKKNDYNLVYNFYAKEVKNAKYNFVKLKDICKIQIGGRAPQKIDEFENGVYPFFRVSDLAKYHLSACLKDTKDKLNNKGIKGLNLFKKGTLLFPKSGATTKLNHRAIMGVDGYVVSHLACIVPNEKKILSIYLFYILSKFDANSLLLNDGYPSLRKECLENINIPLPSLKEQQKIINSINEKQKNINKKKEEIKTIEQALNENINSIWNTA